MTESQSKRVRGSSTWKSRLVISKQKDYRDTFVSIFYDKSESTFLEAAQQVKDLYAACVPKENIVINSFKEINVDNHMEKLISGGFSTYVFHYIGHGEGRHDSKWPRLSLKVDAMGSTEFIHSQVLFGVDLAQNVIVIMDCCNYVPGIIQPRLTKPQPASVRIILDLKGENIICSSKRGLYSYYYKGISTIFTQSLIEACGGNYENIHDFLRALNLYLVKKYKADNLILDRDGKVMDSNIDFSYTELPEINGERQSLNKKAAEVLQQVASGNPHMMETMDGSLEKL